MRGIHFWRFGWFLPIAVACILYVNSGQIFAQEKYTPNHPDVKRMVDRAINGLTGDSINKMGSSSGHITFAALTLVEAAKRYEAEVPSDHQLVERAVGVIKRDIDAKKFDPYNDKHERELYYPSLAVILLCDLGVQKYRSEIETILEFIVQRQTQSGGFAYRGNIHPSSGLTHDGDTSQTQFVWLALWVAKSRGLDIDEQVANRSLKWLMDGNNVGGGTWGYIYDNGRAVVAPNSMSIHMASLSTVYLLADFLNLSPRIARSTAEVAFDSAAALPPSVSIYREGARRRTVGAGSTQRVSVGAGRVKTIKGRGNQFVKENFQVPLPANSNYCLFAFERYAYFREQSEGAVREIPDWYDQCVEHYKSIQDEKSGLFPRSGNIESEFRATCFAVLFLVRSTEILVPPPGQGNLNGGVTLAENTRLEILPGGRMKAFSAVKGLDDVMQLLDSDDIDEQQFQLVQESLAKSVAQLTGDSTKTRRQHLNYMRGLVSNRNYYKRLIAVKLLARQQDMDNVPALIYALGDPNLRVCREAHNGLRLISRKLDSITISDDAGYAEYQAVKNKWTEWFLKIRPGAELLD